MTDSEQDYHEIYKQRYETFRHLDKLRWQMVQILVALLSASALFAGNITQPDAWWFQLAAGLILVLLAAAMLKISQGIRKNNLVLLEAAQRVGDPGPPSLTNPWKSVAHWIALLVLGTGAMLMFLAPLHLETILCREL